MQTPLYENVREIGGTAPPVLNPANIRSLYRLVAHRFVGECRVGPRADLIPEIRTNCYNRSIVFVTSLIKFFRTTSILWAPLMRNMS
jgi:hypothetical protein